MDWTSIWQQVDARIERASARLRFAVRAVVIAADPTSKLPGLSMEVLAGELLPTIELFQHAGFKSVPVPGAEAIVLQVGGRGGHYVVVATADRATAPSGLVAGDACIYGLTGAKVLVKADGSVEISTPVGGSIALDVLGNVTLNGGLMGVARVGDTVTVDPSTHQGTITGGSATVKAG